MTNRAATFSAVIITGIAAVSLATGADSPAFAAEDCLAAPKGDATQGGHWYYRSDPVTKCKCWYISDQRDGARRKPSSVAAVAKPRTPPVLRQSVADARAEFFDAMENRERASVPQPPAIAAAPAVTEANNVAGDPTPVGASDWIMASRWADRGDTQVAAPPSQVAEASPPIAVTEPVAEPEESYLLILMALLAGALAFGGTAVAVIIRNRRAKKLSLEAIREPFRMDWNDDEGVETAPARSPHDPTMKWVRIAREIQDAKNPGREVEELLATVPRRPVA